MKDILSGEKAGTVQQDKPDGYAETEVKSTYLYLVQTGGSSILSLISIPIITHELAPGEFGVFALTQVYAIIAMGIANFGMATAYERNFFQYASCREKSGALFYSVTTFVAVNVVILGVGAYCWRADLSGMLFGSGHYGGVLVLVFAGTGLSSLVNYYLTYLKNKGLVASYVKIAIGQSLCNFILLLAFLLYFDFGVEGMAWAWFLSNAGTFVLVSTLQCRIFAFSFDKKIFTDALKIAWPLTPRIFFGFLGTQFDKMMLGMLATIGGVGVYSMAQTVSYAVFQFMTALDRVFIPEMYRKLFSVAEEEDAGREIGRYLVPFIYASIFAALLMALFSEELFIIFMPKSYAGGIDIVTILSIFYASMFFGKVTGTQLIYAKKTHVTSLLTLVSIALNVLLNIPMIIQWGAIGAAWATLLAGMTSGFISFRVAQHYARVEWEWGAMAWIYGTFIVAAMLCLCSHMFMDSYYWMRLLAKFIAVVVYLYVGMRIGIVTAGNGRILYATAVAMLSKKTHTSLI